MKLFSSLILSLCSVLVLSQTILYQPETASRTVQDPQSVVMAQGFHATSNVSNPFIAKIGPATGSSGGGPVDSGAGGNNPSGATTSKGQPFHDTKGNIDVSGSGQLQFTLPIALPPGVKNIAPQTNLVYTSGTGNGSAGYGWNISGISSISRVGKNVESDAETKGIKLDYSDRYSFNGQRLILKNGEYGKDGSEYVTEKYSNVKIRSIGSINPAQGWQGPEYWEVTFEDGSQAWFGRNSSARTPTEYNISEWKDAQGNYISYEYILENNIAAIDNIKWGGNKTLNTPHFNNIQFNYSTPRTLNEQSYINGIRYTQTMLLSEIKVTSNGNPFKRYSIEYTNNGTSYQFANKITEYNADGVPSDPVILKYPGMVNSYAAAYDTEPDPFNNVKFVGDFNGDSYLDFLMNNGTVKLGALNETFTSIATGKTFANNAKVVNTLLDEDGQIYHGNGVVEYSDNKVSGYILKNNAFIKVFEKPITPTACTNCAVILNEGDIDGDGISDIFLTLQNAGSGFGFVDRLIIDLKNPNNPLLKHSIDWGLDENLYTDQKHIDVDGDGKIDIINVSNTTYTVFEFVKTSSDRYTKKIKFSGSLLENKDPEFPVLYGDFNGDGKLDFAIPITDYAIQKPDDWRFYMGTEKGFTPYLKKEFFTYRKFQKEVNGNYAKFAKQYFFSVTDMNKDGKSDVVQVFSYNQINMMNANGSRDFGYVVSAKIANGSDIDGTPNFTPNWSFQSPKFQVPDLLDLTLFAPMTNPVKSGNNYYNVFIYWKDILHKIQGPTPIAQLARISSIKQGGITTRIKYLEMVPDNINNPDFYKKDKKVVYPYYSLSRADQMYAVSQLEQDGRKQDFRYRGVTGNMPGKRMVGYHQTANSSWYANGFEKTKIWSGIEIDPLKDGAPVKLWSIRTNDESKIFPADLSENNTQLLTFKSTSYQSTQLVNGQAVSVVSDDEKPKVVKVVLPLRSREKDFLTGTITSNGTSYGDYYLPTSTTSIVNDDLATTRSSFEYIHNPTGTGADYYIGRPKSKTDIIYAYGDNKSVKQEYTYENNLLKNQKNWNRDNTGYLQETYSYDGFGNIIQKDVANSIDNQTQTSRTEYDPKGRFVIKKIDNLGLETNIVYNDWGQIEKQTDPLGNTLINKYDRWGMLLTSKTNLEGTTSYQYYRDDDSNITITQYDPDNDISKKYINKIGQTYKVSNKTFRQGRFIARDTYYDLLGRIVKESEPYYEQSLDPSSWNTMEYDDSVFPAKVKAKSFNGKETETFVTGLTTTVHEVNGYGRTNSQTTDALGNVISTTDKGGTIVFSYNAAGEQIKAQYAENIVVTKYDPWGRRSEFNDPSNGLYKYEYDGFGQPTKIISPKGTKEYTYNALGQLITQKEFSTTDGGAATDKIISFTYDNKGRLISKAGTSKGKSFSSNASYDPQGRLLSSSESSNGKYFMQKGITYDDKARVVSYEKHLYSSGVLTKVQIENVYHPWNGDLYLVKDKETGKNLWELKETDAKGRVWRAKLGTSELNSFYDDNGFLTRVNHSSSVKSGILQLSYSFDALKNELTSRTTGGDFNITESFSYDDNNRLTNWANPITGIKDPLAILNVYDTKGRILENDQIGKIKFENSAKIYQPTGMTLNAAGMENYNNDLIQSIIYNENNDPVFIDGEKGDVAFQYGLTAMRQRATYGGNFIADGEGKFTKFYSEDGSFEVVKDNTTGKEKHILYVEGSPYESNIVYLKNYDESIGSYKFLHKDYLGSILAISDEAGNKLEQRHFDAWGNLTHLQIGSGAIITDKQQLANTDLLINRGYTGHEHFAEVGLIHMNGRLYDPLLRRFLSADENIQAPFNTQNYNKYGYVLNNPLMYADPSGEFIWIAVGALAGAYFTGVKANGSWNPTQWNWGATWGKIAMGGAIGAFTGGVGAAVGASAATVAATSWGISGGLLGGAIAGATGGAVAGAINGFATAVMFGENVLKGTAMGGLYGAAIGGVAGGISGAVNQVLKNIQAAKIGAPQGTILKNAPIAENRSAWTLNNTAKVPPKTTTVGKVLKVEVGEVIRQPDPAPEIAKKININECLDCQNPRFIFDSKGKGLDLKYFNSLTENSNSNIIAGGKGGANIVKMSGPPNSYTNLNNGHVVVYGPQGKPIFDISAVRVKGIFYNTTPDGRVIPSFGNSTKFDGSTPQSLKDFFGL
ncbi:RHS repeat-associated core domain-containing protein [Chryseobacterium jejuense]|uniref:RHS repeat-associated core domain-containing protein n=1 Tax=Chryseobacterium jejuense TaxID=445960 RepID=UPI001AE92EB5|nr:RHS repeat-associated core domain-containing protein [Chryseobacterium jejuense]MBP2618391.1 RHS repeat-associated protein [Chryseobacterium jejuense]